MGQACSYGQACGPPSLLVRLIDEASLVVLTLSNPEYAPQMLGRVTGGGPRNDETHDVGDFPEKHLDFEEAPDLEALPDGAPYPEESWDIHRYELSSVETNPDAPEPRATYRYAGTVPVT